MGVDNIQFGSDTEVIQLLIHNALLTLSVMLQENPRLDIALNRIE